MYFLFPSYRNNVSFQTRANLQNVKHKPLFLHFPPRKKKINFYHRNFEVLKKRNKKKLKEYLIITKRVSFDHMGITPHPLKSRKLDSIFNLFDFPVKYDFAILFFFFPPSGSVRPFRVGRSSGITIYVIYSPPTGKLIQAYKIYKTS